MPSTAATMNAAANNAPLAIVAAQRAVATLPHQSVNHVLRRRFLHRHSPFAGRPGVESRAAADGYAVAFNPACWRNHKPIECLQPPARWARY